MRQVVEDQLRGAVIIVTLRLLLSILRVVPQVNFSVGATRQQDLLIAGVPLKAGDLLLVEIHFIQVVVWHAHVPHSQKTVFSCASK